MLLSCSLKESFQITLAIVILAGKVNSKFCNGGHICSPPKECCPLGCCIVYTSSGYRPSDTHISKTSSVYNLLLQNHWLFWLLLALLLFFCLCACGMWKKRQFFTNRWWRENRSIRNEEDRSELDSIGSCYPPPQYSRCSSFHYAPPPYTEVTSKPDLYPLVINYRSDNGKFGDNRLMVQYFRSYVVHPALGSLSDGSTVDSFGSGFFSQSIHEADSSLPPTYEEFRIEERNLSELEPSTARAPHTLQQNDYFSPEKIIRNSTCENFLETRNPTHSDEIHQVVVENIHRSIQQASLTTATTSSLKTTALNNLKVLQNSAQSLPNNLCLDQAAIKKKLVRPNNLNLGSFQRTNPITISSCEDSINANNNYVTHQYSSDVILAQPQSYCDSSIELHYHSSDILNRLNHCLHNVNNSYSSEDNLSQPRGSLQDFVSSDGLSHSQLSNLEVNNFSTSSDVSSLQGCGSPDSPPQATSPTGEFRNLLDKIQLLPVHKDPVKFDQTQESGFAFFKNLKSFEAQESQKFEEATNDNAEVSDSESGEKFCLFNESAQPFMRANSKKSSPVSQKLFIKENFPSRSKTFYMPFCYNSLKRSTNSKLSTSAPVTPVTNLPSPGSYALGLATNKFGSKKCMPKKGDSIPLLPNGEESHDEVF